MAKPHLNITITDAPRLVAALATARGQIDRAFRKAVKDAVTPPPPGMVRLNISATISEELLKDEPALGAYLVRLAKRSLGR